MYQQQEQTKSNKQLTKSQMESLTSYCQYISHIIFPHQCQKLLEQKICISLMNIEQRQKKYENIDKVAQNYNYEQIKSLLADKQQEDILNQLHYYHQVLVDKVGDFYAICTELFYFLFACLRDTLMVDFHHQLIVYHTTYNRFMIVIKQVSHFNQDEKLNIKNTNNKNYYQLYIKIVRQIIRVLQQNLMFITKIIRLAKAKPEVKVQQKANLNNIKISLLQIKQDSINHLLAPIVQLKENAQLVNAQIFAQNDSKSFTELQKCQFISRHSSLYRIRNRSINILLFRHNSQAAFHQLKLAFQSEKKLRQLYLKTKKLKNDCQQELNQIINKIGYNFMKYARENWTQNPLYKAVIQQNSEQKAVNQNQYKGHKKQILRTKISFKTYLKTIREKFKYEKETKTEQQKNKQQAQKKQNIEYSVQLIVPKQILTIRLITPIALQQSNIDVLLQNWNCMSYNAANICIQIVQKMEIMHKKRKFIVIKSTNQIKQGESVMWHCFRSMDILMVVYKLIQSQSAYNYQCMKNNQIAQFQNKIKHYSKLMTELSRKLSTLLNN